MKEAEPKFSFFNLIGFLFPGIIFLTFLFPTMMKNDYIYMWAIKIVTTLLDSNTNSSTISIAVILIFPALAISFLLGVFIATFYSWVLAKFVKEYHKDTEQGNSYYSNLKAMSPDEAMAKKFFLRESLVLHYMGGMDLYGMAARKRMLGSGGFSIILASVGYFIVGWILAGICFVVLGLVMLIFASILHNYYNATVDENAYLFYDILKLSTPSPDIATAHNQQDKSILGNDNGVKQVVLPAIQTSIPKDGATTEKQQV